MTYRAETDHSSGAIRATTPCILKNSRLTGNIYNINHWYQHSIISFQKLESGATVSHRQAGLRLLYTLGCEGPKMHEVTKTKETNENSLYNDKIFQTRKSLPDYENTFFLNTSFPFKSQPSLKARWQLSQEKFFFFSPVIWFRSPFQWQTARFCKAQRSLQQAVH